MIDLQINRVYKAERQNDGFFYLIFDENKNIFITFDRHKREFFLVVSYARFSRQPPERGMGFAYP